MKTLTIAAFAIGLLAGSGVRLSAEAINLSTIKCAEFIATSKEEIGYAAAWLDAFYHTDEDDPLIVDSDKLQANAKKLSDFCAANPDIRVISASEKLLSR
jgi:acid stress chaperone HdeB